MTAVIPVEHLGVAALLLALALMARPYHMAWCARPVMTYQRRSVLPLAAVTLP